MKRTFKLSIPKPCAEKWENFNESSLGGFCNSCSKVVVDFTKMNDSELIDFFSSKPTHTCGRFRPDQMKQFIQESRFKISPGFGLFKASLLTLMFIVISKPGSAQRSEVKTKTETIQQPVNSIAETSTINDGQLLRGVVMASEDKSPLPGVNVVLKGDTIGTATDEDGRFEFPKKLKQGDVLVFSFIGLQTKEYRVPMKDIDVLEVPMLMFYLRLDVTGEVAIEEIYSPPTRAQQFWLKVKELF